jgi:hypothetical protein
VIQSISTSRPKTHKKEAKDIVQPHKLLLVISLHISAIRYYGKDTSCFWKTDLRGILMIDTGTGSEEFAHPDVTGPCFIF